MGKTWPSDLYFKKIKQNASLSSRDWKRLEKRARAVFKWRQLLRQKSWWTRACRAHTNANNLFECVNVHALCANHEWMMAMRECVRGVHNGWKWIVNRFEVRVSKRKNEWMQQKKTDAYCLNDYFASSCCRYCPCCRCTRYYVGLVALNYWRNGYTSRIIHRSCKEYRSRMLCTVYLDAIRNNFAKNVNTEFVRVDSHWWCCSELFFHGFWVLNNFVYIVHFLINTLLLNW